MNKLIDLNNLSNSIDEFNKLTSAKPAATLHAPTPIFLIDVGYSSAVYTGMIVLPALIVNFPNDIQNIQFVSFNFTLNLPIMTNVIFNQSIDSPSQKAARRHESPVAMKVAEKSHFLPVFMMIYIAIPIAGISTRPASACVM